jgi:hypothetical protein
MVFPDDFFRVGKEVFRVNRRGVWFYSMSDIIESITGSNSFVIKIPENVKCEIIERVGDKKMFTDLAGVFRLIQSIEHPKAEPFKMWLANLGINRIKALGGNTDG